MATLHFPAGTHSGKLVWNHESERLTPEQIDNASHLLYYMGYEVYQDLPEEGFSFGMRLYKKINNNDNYRNVLFDFILLFHWMDINLPDLEYSKVLLSEYFVPFEEKHEVPKTKAIALNDTIYLILTDNYMVSGEGYLFYNLEIYLNVYKDGDELLPYIGRDMIQEVAFRIKIDIREGEPLNDPYSWDNNRENDTDDTTNEGFSVF